MLEPHELSTWRADAPPTDLRARALGVPRRGVAPRLALSGVALAGVAATVVAGAAFLGAPMKADAASAKDLVVRAKRKLNSAGLVHLREYWMPPEGGSPVLLRDLKYAEPGQWRVTSPAGKGGDRMFQRLTRERPSTVVFLNGVSLLRNEEIAARGDRDSVIVYYARQGGRVHAMREEAPQNADFTVDGIAREYFGDGASEFIYRDAGGADGNRLVVGERRGQRTVWLIDGARGLPLRATIEDVGERGWVVRGRLEFEYPRVADPKWFDAQTLAEHS